MYLLEFEKSVKKDFKNINISDIKFIKDSLYNFVENLGNSLNSIISYAEASRHEGIIYKASNFEFKGKTKFKGQAIQYKGKALHLRQCYQKRNGQYTKTAIEIQKQLKTGKAKYISTGHKNIFMYNFK